MKILLVILTSILNLVACAQVKRDSANAALSVQDKLSAKDDGLTAANRLLLSNLDSVIIEGKILEEQSGNGIAKATILYKRKVGEVRFYSSSNAAGLFRLAIPKKMLLKTVKLKASSPGYSSKIVSFNRSQFPLPFQKIELKKD